MFLFISRLIKLLLKYYLTLLSFPLPLTSMAVKVQKDQLNKITIISSVHKSYGLGDRTKNRMISTQKEVNLKKGCRFVPLKRDVCPLVKHKQLFIDKKCRAESYALCQKQSFTSMSERNPEESKPYLMIDG